MWATEMKLRPDFREIIELLNSHGVDFVIVGAFAVSYHSRPRNTGDLDILVRPELSNAQKLIVALQQFGLKSLKLTPDDFTEAEQIVQIGYPPGRVDLITSLSGVDFEEVWQNRVETELEGLRVSFIGREELIRNKRATGRTKDLADLETLGAQ